MEELHDFGKMRKNVLNKFLKEKKIYGYFIGNVLNQKGRKIVYLNNILNTTELCNLKFDEFFHFASTIYPKELTNYERFIFWTEVQQKWERYIYYQNYKKYNIW